MHEPPEPLAKFLPDAPPELGFLVSKALEKDPNDRYQSAAEMLVDLRRLKKSTTRVSRAYPLGPSVAAPGAPSGPVDAAGPTFRGTPSSVAGTVPAAARHGHHLRNVFFIAGAAVFVAIAVFLFRTVQDKRMAPTAASIKMARLTSAGNAGFATISPDGKYVVYVKGEDGERGLWIRQIASGTDVNVIPPSDTRIIGSTFSSDGNYVYYSASLPDAPVMSVYRSPVIGGFNRRGFVTNDRLSQAASFRREVNDIKVKASASQRGGRQSRGRRPDRHVESQGKVPTSAPKPPTQLNPWITTTPDYCLNQAPNFAEQHGFHLCRLPERLFHQPTGAERQLKAKAVSLVLCCRRWWPWW